VVNCLKVRVPAISEPPCTGSTRFDPSGVYLPDLRSWAAIYNHSGSNNLLVHLWNGSAFCLWRRGIRQVFANSIHLRCVVRVCLLVPSPDNKVVMTTVFWLIAFSYIITIPAEWRLYRSQQSVSRVRCVYYAGIHVVTTDKLNDYQSCLCLIHPHTVSIFIFFNYATHFRSHGCSYVSILAMILSNYGVFSTGFTEETCQRYYLVAPVFKGLFYWLVYPPGLIYHDIVMQTMVSQAILGVRYVQSNIL
jgi:hypothetical protein